MIAATVSFKNVCSGRVKQERKGIWELARIGAGHSEARAMNRRHQRCTAQLRVRRLDTLMCTIDQDVWQEDLVRIVQLHQFGLPREPRGRRLSLFAAVEWEELGFGEQIGSPAAR